jgi:hypothetical protein
MTLRLAQDAKWVRTDWWKWSIWLEGDPEELRDVRSVTYTLHPTFPNPIRVVTDRRTKFRLDSAGWGGFTVRATVELTSKRVQTLMHKLVLRRPVTPAKAKPANPPAATAKPAAAKVFLSYSLADKATAERFRTTLDALGIVVGDASGSIGPGSALQREITMLVEQSDAVLAIRSDAPSRWSEFELKAAARSGVPVIPVYVGEAARLQGQTALTAFNLSASSDASGIGTRIAHLVSQLAAKKG